jgi:fructose-bisphosphate aldolase class I
MDLQKIIATAKAMVADDKGLLAMDESIPSCNKRFAALGIPETVDARRDYRELIITTPHLGDFISGVILCDETIRQTKKDGTPFIKIIEDAGIIPGIKVDGGEVDFGGHPGEKIAEGLDGLKERLAEYAKMGARFAKWRGEIIIGNGLPSWDCINENAKALAQYAALCQEAGLVPIVEPEVIMDGDHTIDCCIETTEDVLRAVFNQLHLHSVALEGIIIKPNMVVPGLDSAFQVSVEEVADATVNLLLKAVPASVPGIAFLSGGQSYQLASARLNAMNVRFKGKLPWALTFSFSRAIQQPALETWQGNRYNVEEAQAELFHRAKCNYAARRGEYDATMERS